MKNIIIIGSKGYQKKYGGLEEFVTNFIDNYNDEDTSFYVPEITNDKHILEENRNNVVCTPIYVKKDNKNRFIRKSILYYSKYIKVQNLKNVIVYVIGYNIGPVLKLVHKKLNKLNVKIVSNPTNIKIKKKIIKNSDYIICDSKITESKIKEKYDIKMSYIPYATNLSDIKDIDSKTKKIMDEYKINSREYYLTVGRFEKYNNFDLLINEFKKSDTQRDLVVVSDVKDNKLYKKLLDKTKFNEDNRIKFIGPIYDKDILIRLRKNARCYIHSNSKGGTNPSLLDALGTTDINIVYNNPYNKEVAKNSALYFNKEENSLKEQIDIVEKFKTKEINEYSKNAKKRIEDNYTWDSVIKKYKKVFNKILEKNK